VKNKETDEETLCLIYRLSLQINVGFEHPRKLRPLNNETPNLAVVLGNRQKIGYPPSLSVLVNCIGSGEKASNDSDALNKV
jgi:hypothetical protein